MKNLLLAVLGLALFSTVALADGFFVWRNKEIDITEPQQKAFLVFYEGREDLVLEVKFEGAPEDFGWIVPLPSVPEVFKPLSSIFYDLSETCQNPYLGMSRSSQRLLQTFGLSSSFSVDTFQVGIYDVALLKDGRLSELMDWLKEHRFFLKEGSKDILEEYLAKNWVFAAIRIRPDEIDSDTSEELASGEIQPLCFTFETEFPVFPLRISAISGEPSEVLIYTLADGGLVPENRNFPAWETHTRWKPYWGHFPNDWFFNSVREHFGDRLDETPLIKSRAVFEPEDMRDIYFVPYNASTFLSSENLRERAEATTGLGLDLQPENVEPLLGFLDNVEEPDRKSLKNLVASHHEKGLAPGQDIRSALWSLGNLAAAGLMTESQKKQAAQSALRWGENGDEWVLIEAIRALESIDPMVAADLAVESMPQYSGAADQPYGKTLVQVCAEVLALHGGEKHAGALRLLVDQYYEPKSWDRKWGVMDPEKNQRWLGRVALQAAAACGDGEAYGELRYQLIKMGRSNSFAGQYERGELHFGSSGNYGFPNALLPGRLILERSSYHDFVVADILGNPETSIPLKDELYKSVAYDRSDTLGIGDDFRAVLLSRLDKLDGRDERLLLDIWQGSIDPPQRVLLPLGKGPGRLVRASSEFNINALAAGYALGVQGRVQTLLDLWHQTDWSLEPEKAVLATAFTLADSVAGVAPVLEYIQEVLASNARLPLIQLEMEVEAQKNPKRIRLVPLDLEFQQNRLMRFLVKNGMVALVDYLLEDSCPPHLRYFFLYNGNTAHKIPPAPRIQALEQLKAEIQTPNIREQVDRTLAGEG